jgi:lysozyme family protein
MELSQELKNEYLDLWQSCSINPAYASNLKQYADTITENKAKYESVSSKTGVPWYVIAVIHGMESTFNFEKHLHNGDKLTARTVHVPPGRPKTGTPPFSWEESAVDALDYDGATGIVSWDIPTMFWFLEGFNGWGYRTGLGRSTTPPSRSAYIYSGTNHYVKGKYIGDGKFDPEKASEQVGCMAQLHELQNRGLVSFNTDKPDPSTIGSVAAWQNILNGCGYYPVLFITGNMDEATVEMTKKFQIDLSLSATGEVDLTTWKAGVEHDKIPGWSEVTPPILNKQNPLPTKLDPSTVGSVAAWQNILNGCGYNPPLPITGNMDDATVQTTKKFQTDLSLSATGEVDLTTWKAGVEHDKIPGWSEVTPPLFKLQNIPANTITKSLYEFYSKKENYDAVHKNVMNWFGTTKNACVAFVSSALRLSGYHVPNANLDGANISLWTVSFSKYLQNRGWTKSTNPKELKPGDIVFTQEGGFGDGVPAHVYVFTSWDKETNQVAWVIDNQGFTHSRNINKGGGGFNFTPFAYFLRG